MIFEVRSKLAAKEFVCNVPWIAISVVTNSGDWPELSVDNRVDCLQLAFLDYDMKLGANDFDDSQATQILDFFERNHQKAQVCLVHCELGQCRSPAIAAALTFLENGPRSDNFFFENYCPNRRVYNLIVNNGLRRRNELSGSNF